MRKPLNLSFWTMLAKSGKKVSERHEIASLSKPTIGYVAKLLREKYCRKDITSRYLLDIYTTLFEKKPEWHHSGFIEGKNSMGRTFFFSCAEADEFENNFPEIEAQYKKKREEITYGFYWAWEKVDGRNVKVLHAFCGEFKDSPQKNFTKCNETIYSEAIKQEGRLYYGCDEPELSDFSEESQVHIYGIYYNWETEGKRKVKTLQVYDGIRSYAPKGIIECDEQIYKNAQKQVGKIYRGWDAPKLMEFE